MNDINRFGVFRYHENKFVKYNKQRYHIHSSAGRNITARIAMGQEPDATSKLQDMTCGSPVYPVPAL